MSGQPEFRARVMKGKLIAWETFGADCDAVWRDGEVYLRDHARSGASELQVSVKRNGRWRLIGGNVVCREMRP